MGEMADAAIEDGLTAMYAPDDNEREVMRRQQGKPKAKKKRCKCGCKKLFIPTHPRQVYLEPSHNPKATKNNVREVVCDFCKEKFVTVRKNQTHCGARCRKNAWRRDHPEFYTTLAQLEKQRNEVNQSKGYDK